MSGSKEGSGFAGDTAGVFSSANSLIKLGIRKFGVGLAGSFSVLIILFAFSWLRKGKKEGVKDFLWNETNFFDKKRSEKRASEKVEIFPFFRKKEPENTCLFEDTRLEQK